MLENQDPFLDIPGLPVLLSLELLLVKPGRSGIGLGWVPVVLGFASVSPLASLAGADSDTGLADGGTPDGFPDETVDRREGVILVALSVMI